MVIIIYGSDCLDASLSLQNKANADGYYMNLQISDVRFFHRYFNDNPPDAYNYTLHAYNSTIVGGYIYYIEPQSLMISKPSAKIY